MKKGVTCIAVVTVGLLTTGFLQAQTIKGNAILGVAAGDRSGCSVSMPDAQTLAVGAYYFDGPNTDGGQVRVFRWNGQAWELKGTPVLGEGANDRCGNAVSMPDSNTLAVGALLNDGNGTDAGHVRLFNWDGNNWVQKGADIDGETDSSSSGNAVSMPDANTVAIGAYANHGVNGAASGHVRVWRWNGQYWVQKGEDMDGEAAGDFSGNAISMPDSNTVAIGALQNDANGNNAGHVRVWTWNGQGWVQKGADIDGLAADDRAGWSVHMPDAHTLAVGAPYHDANGADAGLVRVYAWTGNAWVQKGANLYGQAAGDRAGWTVRMPHANRIAFGCSGSDANGTDAGQVRVFDWNGTAWVQKGNGINGSAAGDRSGWSLSMPNENTVAIGAPFHASNGVESGQARVYTFATTGLQEEELPPSILLYPNPTRGIVNLRFDKTYQQITVVLRNSMGKEAACYSAVNTRSATWLVEAPMGIYMAEIRADNQQYWCKLVVQ